MLAFFVFVSLSCDADLWYSIAAQHGRSRNRGSAVDFAGRGTVVPPTLERIFLRGATYIASRAQGRGKENSARAGGALTPVLRRKQKVLHNVCGGDIDIHALNLVAGGGCFNGIVAGQ